MLAQRRGKAPHFGTGGRTQGSSAVLPERLMPMNMLLSVGKGVSVTTLPTTRPAFTMFTSVRKKKLVLKQQLRVPGKIKGDRQRGLSHKSPCPRQLLSVLIEQRNSREPGRKKGLDTFIKCVQGCAIAIMRVHTL